MPRTRKPRTRKPCRDQKVFSNVVLAAALGVLCSGTAPAKETKIVHKPESIAVRVAKLREGLSNLANSTAVQKNGGKSDAITPMQYWPNWPNWGNWNNWRNWNNWNNWLNWGNY